MAGGLDGTGDSRCIIRERVLATASVVTLRVFTRAGDDRPGF